MSHSEVVGLGWPVQGCRGAGVQGCRGTVGTLHQWDTWLSFSLVQAEVDLANTDGVEYCNGF